MASLRDILPQPRHQSIDAVSGDDVRGSADGVASVRKASVAQRVVPSAPAHGSGVSSVVALPTGQDGTPDFTAIARIGENANRVVHASYDALVEKPRSAVDLARPSQEVIDETTRRTRAALEPIVNGKVQASQAKNFRGAGDKRVAEFIRYTPANTNTAHNSGAKQRIIKMVQAPVDPMEPPRFSRKKTPANPPSPPVPVLHSPTRKLTKEEAADWVVPPAISNWKNNRGYTIPLDKRLASDASSSQDHRINDKFATLAEAMYVAERNAREEVETRAQIQRNVSLKAKEAKEKELRDLAARARSERAGYALAQGTAARVEDSESSRVRRTGDKLEQTKDDSDCAELVQDEPPPCVPGSNGSDFVESVGGKRTSRFGDAGANARRISRFDEVNDEDIADVKRRDAIRDERRREREREQRIRDAHGDESSRPTLKKSKLTRDRDRDMSERVALGQQVTVAGPGEVMYDQRLFNQGGNQRGLSSGFGGQDSDMLYDKPLFGGSSSSRFQYHPRSNSGALGNDDDDDNDERNHDVSRFRADKALGGGGGEEDGSNKNGISSAAHGKPRAPRSTLVEFERETLVDGVDAVSDPFGLNDMLGRISATKPGENERKMDKALNARHGTRSGDVGLSRFRRKEQED